MSDEKEALPEGWIFANIGELCDLINGRGFKTKEWSETGLPIIRIQNLNNSNAKFNHFDGGYDDKHLVRTGDLLFAWSGTPGTSFGAHVWKGEPALLNQHIFRVLISKDDLDKTYFRFAINHKLGELIGNAHGGVGLRHVTKGKFQSTQVSLPPKAEQSRIVSAIESLQERSSRVRDLLAEVGPLVGQLRQSVLRNAFCGKLTADWRRQNPNTEPASELLNLIRSERRERWEAEQLANYDAKSKKLPKNWQDKYKEPEPLAEEELEILHDQTLPDGWLWAPAELIVEPEAEIVYGIVQPGKKLSEGVPYVRGKDIIDGVIQVAQLLKTSEKIAAKYERASLQGGDVLLGIIRATKVAIVPDVLKGANITQGTARFRPSNIIRTGFLAYWLDSPHAQDWLHAHYRGIDMPGLNLRDVRRLPIPIAPLEEQEAVGVQAAKAIASVTLVHDSVASMESLLTGLDQSILSKAFRGELVPQDPSDEPASELLERIRKQREESEAEKKAKKKTSPKKSTRKKVKTMNGSSDELRNWVVSQKVNKTFSFAEIQDSSSSDYESLKEKVFSLLDEKPNVLEQVFNKKSKEVRFRRIRR